MASTAISDIIQHGTKFDSALGRRLVRDLAKAADGVITYKELMAKHKLTRADCEQIPQNMNLVSMVKAERDRRAKKPGKKVSIASNVVELHPAEHLEENLEFVADCCRFAENVMSEEAVRKKWKFNNATWRALAENEALIAAIELEKIRRIRSGQQKRERAQVLVTKAPDVLSGILLDSTANPRHRIDSAKELNAFASGGPVNTPDAADRFQIIINLGSDTLTYNKARRPLSPGEIDPDDSGPDSVDTGMFVEVIAAKGSGDGGNGNAI